MGGFTMRKAGLLQPENAAWHGGVDHDAGKTSIGAPLPRCAPILF
jgi:hypothetical protein